MKHQFITVSVVNVSEKFNELERWPAPKEETLDSISWEKFFHQIPQEQLEVFVCLYLGLKPKEIVEVLKLPNIVRFYNLNVRLKRLYREKNKQILSIIK